MSTNPPQRVIIAGAAGRDFHDFNMVFRDNENYRVIAFTATQIPNIEGRRYPPALSGSLYSDGVPIYAEAQLEEVIREHQVDEVVFSYSDVSHEYVMHLASRVLAAGASFKFLGPRQTMLKASKPVVSVGAVRTGSGKSQTSRRILAALQNELGYERVVAVRHPMPYGDLVAQRVQRFARLRNERSMSLILSAMLSFTPGWTTKRFCARQKRKLTLLSGMAATTIFPSFVRTFTS
jgi:predicted GTPase